MHICVVDADGKVLRRDVVTSDPGVLAKWLGRHCPELVRVVLETGPLSTFLYHGLIDRGVAVECICARHAKGVLSARVNKSDVHDAEGLAQIARTGWFKRVHMKASATHIDRAALRIRVQLITTRTAMANQLRRLLKLFGLRMGTARTSGRRTERLAALCAPARGASAAASSKTPRARCAREASRPVEKPVEVTPYRLIIVPRTPFEREFSSGQPRRCHLRKSWDGDERRLRNLYTFGRTRYSNRDVDRRQPSPTSAPRADLPDATAQRLPSVSRHSRRALAR